MVDTTQSYALDIQAKIASIDLALAQHDRTRQEMRTEPWRIAIAAVGASATLLIAGAALGAFLLTLAQQHP